MAEQLKNFDSGIRLASITSDVDSTLPRYEHDCSECCFLGTIDVNGTDDYDRYDLWVHEHEHSPEDDELILREGPDGDYASMRVRWARQVSDDKKFKLAVELYDRWISRGRFPRRTEAELDTERKRQARVRAKQQIRKAMTDAGLEEEMERLHLLAELMGELTP